MSEQTPAAVAANYFDALARGDVPTAMAQLSAEMVWHQPGVNRFSGDHHGVERRRGPAGRDDGGHSGQLPACGDRPGDGQR